VLLLGIDSFEFRLSLTAMGVIPCLSRDLTSSPKGLFLESIGFLFRFQDKAGMTALIELYA
jgi:hypothetical protein